ncbi:MAG: hypothetical protein CMP28_10685 [Roseibacillus sp.]|nr:hypothetical protein [Roseibacillus sp.]
MASPETDDGPGVVLKEGADLKEEPPLEGAAGESAASTASADFEIVMPEEVKAPAETVPEKKRRVRKPRLKVKKMKPAEDEDDEAVNLTPVSPDMVPSISAPVKLSPRSDLSPDDDVFESSEDFDIDEDLEVEDPPAPPVQIEAVASRSKSGESLHLGADDEGVGAFEEVEPAEGPAPIQSESLEEIQASAQKKRPQGELALDGGPKGRFEGEDPNLLEGEDLDIPPFLRNKK